MLFCNLCIIQNFSNVNKFLSEINNTCYYKRARRTNDLFSSQLPHANIRQIYATQRIAKILFNFSFTWNFSKLEDNIERQRRNTYSSIRSFRTSGINSAYKNNIERGKTCVQREIHLDCIIVTPPAVKLWVLLGQHIIIIITKHFPQNNICIAHIFFIPPTRPGWRPQVHLQKKCKLQPLFLKHHTYHKAP